MNGIDFRSAHRVGRRSRDASGKSFLVQGSLGCNVFRRKVVQTGLLG